MIATMEHFIHNPPQPECMVLMPDQVLSAWPVIRELLAKAVDHGRGEVEVDDILDLVQRRKMFVAVKVVGGQIMAAMAAEIIHYPRRKVLNVAYLGGVSATRHVEFLDKAARLLQADAIRCYCRESIARLARRADPGFERAYIVLEKEVSK